MKKLVFILMILSLLNMIGCKENERTDIIATDSEIIDITQETTVKEKLKDGYGTTITTDAENHEEDKSTDNNKPLNNSELNADDSIYVENNEKIVDNNIAEEDPNLGNPTKED